MQRHDCNCDTEHQRQCDAECEHDPIQRVQLLDRVEIENRITACADAFEAEQGPDDGCGRRMYESRADEQAADFFVVGCGCPRPNANDQRPEGAGAGRGCRSGSRGMRVVRGHGGLTLSRNDVPRLPIDRSPNGNQGLCHLALWACDGAPQNHDTPCRTRTSTVIAPNTRVM